VVAARVGVKGQFRWTSAKLGLPWVKRFYQAHSVIPVNNKLELEH
jgi:hypothetical protein